MSMKKLLVFLVFFGSAFAAINSLDDAGCELKGNQWYCPDMTYVENVSITMIDDLFCISTLNETCSGDGCRDIIDIGCFGDGKLDSATYIESCQSPINDSFDRVCSDIFLPANTELIFIFDAANVNYDECTQPVIEGFIRIQCPYNGRQFTTLLGIFNESEIAFSFGEVEPVGFAFTTENMVYGALVIIIVILAYWVFRTPRKRRYRR
jgi:hypothetical protein